MVHPPNRDTHSLFNPFGNTCNVHPHLRCLSPAVILVRELRDLLGISAKRDTDVSREEFVRLMLMVAREESDYPLGNVVGTLVTVLLRTLNEYLLGHVSMMAELVRQGLITYVAKSNFDSILFTKSLFRGVSFNLYGFSITVYVHRYLRGVGVLQSKASNAHAVAILHLTLMSGVPLPGISNHFNPSTFPSPTHIPPKMAPNSVARGSASKNFSDGLERPFRILPQGTKPVVLKPVHFAQTSKPEQRDDQEDAPTKSAKEETYQYHNGNVVVVEDGVEKKVFQVSGVIIAACPTGKPRSKYGTNYVYAGIPKYAMNFLHNLLRGNHNITLYEEKFAPDANYVWVTLNDASELHYVAKKADAVDKVSPNVVKNLYQKDSDNWVCNLHFSVFLKSKLSKSEVFDPKTSPVRVVITPVRGFIVGFDKNVEFPGFQSNKVDGDRVVYGKDVMITDELANQLKALGIGL